MSLKFDSARNKMVNEIRKNAGLTVYEPSDRPKNAGRYNGSGMSDVEIAKAQNDNAWLERNGYSSTETNNVVDTGTNNDNSDSNILTGYDNESLLRYCTDLGDGWYRHYELGYLYYDGTNIYKKTEAEYQAYATEKESIEAEQAEMQAKYKSAISSKMSKFATVLNNLKNKFNHQRPVYVSYLNFIVNGRTLVNTTSSNWDENNLISLTHTLTGAGQANTFILEILFKPNDRNIRNINEIEAKLLAACSIQNEDGSLKSIAELYGNCEFTYGYSDANIKSQKYTGRVMKYKSKIENGNIRYTIEGYCGLYGAKEIRLSNKTEYDPSGTETSPLQYIANIFEIEFKNDGKYSGLFDIKFLESCYKDNQTLDGTNLSDDWKIFDQKNIFQIMDDILAGTCTSEQADKFKSTGSISPTEMDKFGYYLDDTPTNTASLGTVYVYLIKSNSGKSEIELDNEVGTELTFNYYAPSSGINHLVKSWDPEYEGEILMSLAIALQTQSRTFQTMDANGEIISVQGLGAARLGTLSNPDAIYNTIQEYNKWCFVTQYPYKASLTIMGCPCEVPITGKIKINALIGTQLHHTSGIYMILGKKDNISSSGFYSTFELFKVVSGYKSLEQQFNTKWIEKPIDTSKILNPEDTSQYISAEEWEDSLIAIDNVWYLSKNIGEGYSYVYYDGSNYYSVDDIDVPNEIRLQSEEIVGEFQ